MSSEFDLKDIQEMLNEAATVKDMIRKGLTDIKVPVSENEDPDVMSAVLALFGSQNVKDGKTYITFDMVTKCLEILRIAGMEKARSLIQ